MSSSPNEEYREYVIRVDNNSGVRVESPDGSVAESQIAATKDKCDLVARLLVELENDRNPSLDYLFELGEHLGELLLGSNAVERHFSRAYEAASKDGLGGLHIRLEIAQACRVTENNSRLAGRLLSSLPWELTYCPSVERRHFLAAHRCMTFSRLFPLNTPIQPLTVDPPLKLLWVSAQPTDLSPVLSDIAKTVVMKALQPLIKRRVVQVTFVDEQPCLATLSEKIDDIRPDILHFMGHAKVSDGNATVALVKSDGKAAWHDAKAMATVFDTWQPGLAMFVACEGAGRDSYRGMATISEELVRADLCAVVGMQFEVSNRLAIDFSREFYALLAENVPIDKAVQLTRRKIYDGESPAPGRSFAAPVLYLRSPNSLMLNIAAKKGKKPKRHSDQPLSSVDPSKAIVVFGPGEDVRRDDIQQLFDRGFRHFSSLGGRLRPSDISWLKTVSFIVPSDLESQLGQTVGIVASGFKATSEELADLMKRERGASVIFFHEELGITESIWRGFGDLELVENQSLTMLLLGETRRAPRFSLPPDVASIKREYGFVNRDVEIRQIRDSIESPSERCCKIFGWKGLGKRALLRFLSWSEQRRHFIELDIVDEAESAESLMRQFANRLGKPAVASQQFSSRGEFRDAVRSLMERFDTNKDTILVIHNLERVANPNGRGLRHDRLSDFLDEIVNRASFKGNKILIPTCIDLELGQEIDDVCRTVRLSRLDPADTREMLNRELTRAGKEVFLPHVDNLDNTTLKSLFGGYPQLVKLFAAACDVQHIGQLLKIDDSESEFADKKLEYLLQAVPLDDGELILLERLATLGTPFSTTMLGGFDKQESALLRQLLRRGIVEKTDYLTYSEYYVPDLIRDSVLSRMDDTFRQQCHERLGDDFFAKAEDFETRRGDEFELYRLALHHYVQAACEFKRESLVFRFRDVFLNKARIAFGDGDYESAWKYFHRVDVMETLSPYQGLLSYLICCAMLDHEDTQDLYERSIDLYGDNPHLVVSYGYFLLRRGQIEKADKVVNTVFTEHSLSSRSRRGPVNLLAKVRAAQGRRGEAVSILRDQLSALSPRNGKDEVKKSRVSAMMNLFSILDWSSLVKSVLDELCHHAEERCVRELLETPFSHDTQDVAEAYERAVNHDHAVHESFENYSKFLTRMGHVERAKKVSTEGAASGRRFPTKSQLEMFYFEPYTVDDLVPTFVLGAPRGGNIGQLFTECEDVMTSSQELLADILAIDPSNHRALHGTAHLLKGFHDLRELRSFAANYGLV